MHTQQCVQRTPHSSLNKRVATCFRGLVLNVAWVLGGVSFVTLLHMVLQQRAYKISAQALPQLKVSMAQVLHNCS